MLSLNYDEKFDVLYLGFADKRNSYGEENDKGVVTFRDFCSNEITGVTIFGFKERFEGLSNRLEE